MSQKSILLKRLASGTIDFLFASFISSIFLYFGSNGAAGTIIAVYTMMIYRYQSTLGGIILNLKISSLNNKEIKGGLSLLRAILMYALVEVVSLSLLGNSFSIIFICSLIFLNIASFILSKRGVMIHDVIVRSFVENDEEKKHAKEKKQLVALLVILIIAKAFVTYKKFNSTSHCFELTKQHKFQEVINQCAKKSKTNTDSSFHLNLSISYMQLQKYDDAIVEAKMASFLGEKTVSPYILLSSYLALKNYDSALKISENQIDDPLMLYISAISYTIKYSNSSDPKHLIMAASYFKLITPEMMNKKYDNKMVQEIVNKSLGKDNFNKVSSAINAMIDKNLTPEQQSEIDTTANMLRQK